MRSGLLIHSNRAVPLDMAPERLILPNDVQRNFNRRKSGSSHAVYTGGPRAVRERNVDPSTTFDSSRLSIQNSSFPFLHL